MRSLKKTLTLALVFVMAIGLLSAGAVDFTDADDIQYAEAVEVMTGIGAINGYPDGTFNPDGLVTRAEAAKLVTYAILTPNVAEYLPKGTSSFDDVPANHWAAPYIEYCVSQGIVNGRGNGKFDPNGNVTAYELAKMLLVAAGYGRNNEYVGATWSLNVAIDAHDKGIFTGTQADNYAAPATREEAALYVFNGLSRVAQVKFSKDTESYELTVTPNGQTIGAQKYGLFKDNAVVNGVSGYTWKNGIGVALSSFITTDNVIATSTNGTPLSDLTNQYGPFYKASLDADAEFFINGRDYTSQGIPGDGADSGNTYYTFAAYSAVAGNTTYATEAAFIAKQKADHAAAAATAIDKSGVVVNFINTDLDAKAEKVVITEKTVDFVTGKVTVSGGNVAIPGIGTYSVNAVVYPADLAKDDVVLVYTDALNVTHIEKAASVTGRMTARTWTGAIIFDGATRGESQLAGVTALSGFTTYNQDATIWLDDNGNVVHFVVGDTAALANYCVVLDSAPSGFEIIARVLFMDGSTKTVTLGSVDSSAPTGSEATNKFYTYAVDSNGAYHLATVSSAGSVALDSQTNTAITNVAMFDGENLGNSNTVFVVPNSLLGGGFGYTVFTGIANAPLFNDSTPDADFEVVSINGIARYVYIYSGTYTATPATNNVYFINKNVYTQYPLTATNPAYREYAAIVDGEVTTVKVLESEASAVATGLFSVKYDADGYINDADGVVSGKDTGTGIVSVGNGVVVFGSSKVYTYNDNTVVYYISPIGTVTKGTASDLTVDGNDTWTVRLTPSPADAADLVAEIYVQEVPNP